MPDSGNVKSLFEFVDEVIEFYGQIPIFKPYIDQMAESVIECIVAEQYIIRRENGKIKCFITYWRTDEKGFEALQKKQTPKQRYSGPIIYGRDCASLLPKQETLKALNELRMMPHTAIAFHNDNRLKVFRR